MLYPKIIQSIYQIGIGITLGLSLIACTNNSQLSVSANIIDSLTPLSTPSNFWILVRYRDPKTQKVKFNLRDKNNESVRLDLPNDPDYKVQVENNQLYIHYEQTLELFDPGNQRIIHSKKIPFKFNQVVKDKRGSSYYVVSIPDPEGMCQIYKIGIIYPHTKVVLSDNKSADFKCDTRTKIVHVNEQYIWIFWEKRTRNNHNITSFYKQFDLRNAQMKKRVIVDKVMEENKVQNVTITSEIDEQLESFDYQCSYQNDKANCVNYRGENIQVILPQVLPFVVDKMRDDSQTEKIICGLFDYNRYRDDAPLLYNNQILDKYQDVIIEQVSCLVN